MYFRINAVQGPGFSESRFFRVQVLEVAINFQVVNYSLAKCRKLLLGSRINVIIYTYDMTSQRKHPRISRLQTFYF